MTNSATPGRRAAILAALATALTLPATRSLAQITTWAAPVSGDWFDASRWTAGVPNSPTTSAVIPLTGAAQNFTITLAADATVNTLSATGSTPFTATIAQTGGTLTVTRFSPGPIAYQLTNGTLAVTRSATIPAAFNIGPNGTLQLGPAAGFSSSVATPFTNAGRIQMGLPGGSAAQYQHVNLSFSSLTNQGVVAIPEGYSNQFSGTLTNTSTGLLQIGKDSVLTCGTIVNDGTVSLAPGAQLYAGGTFHHRAGSVIGGMVILGGTSVDFTGSVAGTTGSYFYSYAPVALSVAGAIPDATFITIAATGSSIHLDNGARLGNAALIQVTTNSHPAAFNGVTYTNAGRIELGSPAGPGANSKSISFDLALRNESALIVAPGGYTTSFTGSGTPTNSTSGTISIGANSSLVTQAFLNDGLITLAPGASLSSSGTFHHRTGSVLGGPVLLTGAFSGQTLDFTGSLAGTTGSYQFSPPTPGLLNILGSIADNSDVTIAASGAILRLALFSSPRIGNKALIRLTTATAGAASLAFDDATSAGRIELGSPGGPGANQNTMTFGVSGIFRNDGILAFADGGYINTIHGRITNSPTGLISVGQSSQLNFADTAGSLRSSGTVTLAPQTSLILKGLLQNAGTFQVSSATTSTALTTLQATEFTNTSTGHLIIDNPTVLLRATGGISPFVNDGRIDINHASLVVAASSFNANGIINNTASTLTFTGLVRLRGPFESHSAENNFVDLTVSGGGTLTCGPGDLFNFANDLTFHPNYSTDISLAQSTVAFTSTGPDSVHTFLLDRISALSPLGTLLLQPDQTLFLSLPAGLTLTVNTLAVQSDFDPPFAFLQGNAGTFITYQSLQITHPDGSITTSGPGIYQIPESAPSTVLLAATFFGSRLRRRRTA